MYRPDLKKTLLAPDTSSTVDELREGLNAVGKSGRRANGEVSGTEEKILAEALNWKPRGQMKSLSKK